MRHYAREMRRLERLREEMAMLYPSFKVLGANIELRR